MSIDLFSEKKIRNALLNKLIGEKRNGSHDKINIILDGKKEARIKLPNNHVKTMMPSKSRWIASALRLNDDDFNDLINCPLTGPKYLDKLREWRDNS